REGRWSWGGRGGRGRGGGSAGRRAGRGAGRGAVGGGGRRPLGRGPGGGALVRRRQVDRRGDVRLQLVGAGDGPLEGEALDREQPAADHDLVVDHADEALHPVQEVGQAEVAAVDGEG